MTMKKSILLILSFYIIVLFNGCEKEDNGTNNITGIGDIVTETLDLSSFHSIKNTGVANIYITVGDTQSVVLKAQQNIIDVITYEANNSTLEIGIQNNTSINESLNVTITGVGSVYFKGNPTISSTITGLGKLVDDND